MTIKYLPHREIDFSQWDTCLDQAENSFPYAYSWYLDIVSRGKWDGLVSADYQMVMPLVWNTKLFGYKQLYTPVICQQLGVYGSQVSMEVVQVFLDQIPAKFRKIQINLNEATPAGILHYPGVSRACNLVLPLDQDYSSIRKGYSKSLRKRLRKTKEKLNFELSNDPDFLVTYYREQLMSKVSFSPRDWQIVHKLFKLCVDKEKGEVYRVVSPKGEVLACGIFLFHQRRIFNVFGASNAEGRAKYAMHYLLDQIIQQNAGKKSLLDFEGSEIPGVASFFRSFGAVERPYYRYSQDRLPGWMKGLLALKKKVVDWV